MRTLVPVLLLLMVSTAGAQSITPYHNDPQLARFVTTDIDHFWAAYDLAYPWFDAMIFDSLYLRPATTALHTFIPFRIDNADSLASTIRRHWDYYESVRASTLAIREQAPQFRASYYALKYLYPEAVFPDIYFVIGRLNAVATSTADGIVISAERYGPLPPLYQRGRCRPALRADHRRISLAGAGCRCYRTGSRPLGPLPACPSPAERSELAVRPYDRRGLRTVVGLPHCAVFL